MKIWKVQSQKLNIFPFLISTPSNSILHFFLFVLLSVPSFSPSSPPLLLLLGCMIILHWTQSGLDSGQSSRLSLLSTRKSVLSHHTQLSPGISNQNLRTRYMVSFLTSPVLKSSIAVCSPELSLKSNESIFSLLRVWEQILPKGGGWKEERFRYFSAFLSCRVALLTVGCTEVTWHLDTKCVAQNWKDGFITRGLGRGRWKSGLSWDCHWLMHSPACQSVYRLPGS